MSDTTDLPIAEVATRLGISTRSLRRWETLGSMPFKVRRTTLGWRVYSTNEVDQLRAFCAARRESITRSNDPK
jgi:DNA-binding transcriptional MerR regulator